MIGAAITSTEEPMEAYDRDSSRIRVVDEEIRLIPYYRNDEMSLPWYQDPHV